MPIRLERSNMYDLAWQMTVHAYAQRGLVGIKDLEQDFPEVVQRLSRMCDRAWEDQERKAAEMRREST
jgi:hypothetical protein